MLRLKVRVPSEDIQDFMQRLMSDPSIEYWEKKKINEYRYNWTYSVEDSSKGEKYSFYMAYRHNTERPGDKYNFVLEYNPNKCPMNGLLAHVMDTYFYSSKVQVVSADVAVDFPVNIRNLLIDRGEKRVYKYFESPGNGISHYFGNGGAGQVKIYNKTAEANLNYDLTRYEIRVGVDLPVNDINALKVNLKLPGVFVLSEQITMEMQKDKTLLALIYAVSAGYPVNLLTRTYREKIKPLNVNERLEIGELQIADTIKAFIKNLFRK